MNRRDILPHLLCAIVGISAWIEINGTFAELGHMKSLPEGKSIASIIVIIVQIGNIVPLLYTVLPLKPQLRWSMVIVLGFGITSLVFLASFWDQTYTIFDEERSLMLYIGTFIAAGADCLSNVVFWPYVGQFPRSYITAMGTGESLSSAVSAIVSSSQKAIGFSPSTFFVVLIAIVCVSCVCYGILEFKFSDDLKSEAREKAISSSELPTQIKQTVTTESNVDTASEEASERISMATSSQSAWKNDIPLLSVIAGVAFVQNALNPSLLPFACKGYSNAHWISQNALFIASPVMSISASFFQPRKSIIPAVCCWIGTSLFILVAAAQSTPILADQTAGTAMMAGISIISGASLAYTKVSAMLHLRSRQALNKHGEKLGYNKEFTQRLLTSAGISMQVGSIAGAVSMFLLVQIGKVFPK
jgi:riboflavin transporter 2